MKRSFFTVSLGVVVLGIAVGNWAWSQQAPSGQSAAGNGTAAGAAGGAGNQNAVGGQNAAGVNQNAAGAANAGQPGFQRQAPRAGNIGSQRLGRQRGGVNSAADFSAAVGFNTRFSRNPWFNEPGALQQLQLTPAQLEQLQRAYQNALERFQEGVARAQANPNLDERQRQLQALEERFNRNFGRVLDSVFTNPQMRQRFDQLNRQFQGFGAFNDAQLQRQMNLTPAQRHQLARLNDQWGNELLDLQRLAATDPAQANLRFGQMQQLFQNQLGQALSPQQLQMWSQTIGQPHNFPFSAFMNREPGTAPSGGVNDPRALQNQTGGNILGPAGPTGVGQPGPTGTGPNVGNPNAGGAPGTGGAGTGGGTGAGGAGGAGAGGSGGAGGGGGGTGSGQ